VRGDLDAATRVVDACTISHIAASLGGVIRVNLIRSSVDTEDTDDLIEDLSQALDHAFADA
jgi:cystathionine beta-lyase/cystathionine gamma-synthase